MRKLSKIDESVWGGILDRGSGETIRKEDDINNYDGQQMAEYINDHYTTIAKGYEASYSKNTDTLYTSVIERKINKNYYHVDTLFYEYDTNTIYIAKGFYEDTFKRLMFRSPFSLSIYDDDYYSITPKKGDVNNIFFLEIIDFIINNTTNKECTVISRKINESVWGGILDRGSGETERKEDIIGNIKSLKPVDMGGSVLWADNNLIVDGKELFTFYETNELISNLKIWRLPTLKEVAELDGHNIYYDKDYIYLYNDRKISFKKCGVEYNTQTNFTIDKGKCFYGWTSEPYNNRHDINVLYIDENEISYSPINMSDRNIANVITQQGDVSKCCIRLVKDK